jgi:uncharacterized protein YqeY
MFKNIYMTLQEQIRNDLKEAMRAGDAAKRDVLRMLESAVKNAAIEKKLDRETIDDALVQEVVRRSVKQRKDSIEQYEQGGRADLAEQERQEVAVLRQYLPAAMGEEELRAVVVKALEESAAASPADFGKAMGKAMQAVSGRAEGDAVKKIVEELLGK